MSFDPATFRQIRTIHSLRPENTFASAIVGDNWVVTAIAHIDRLGRQIIPLRVRRSGMRHARARMDDAHARGG